MGTKKLWSLMVCLFAVLVLGIGSASAQETLKIGVIAPLSGTGAGWGLALRAGAELAADDINAKGGLEVGGKKYKLTVIPYDDQYKGPIAADAANRLVFMDKVKYIIAPMGSAAGLAMQEITEPNKVFLVGDSFTSKFLAPNKLFSFRTTMTSFEFALPMIKWFKAKYPNLNKIAITGPNDESGWETAGSSIDAHKAVGHEMVFQDYYERGTVDFMPLLNKAFAQKPDVFNWNGTNPGDCGLLQKQARQMGFKGMIIKVGGPGTPEMMKVAGKELMEGFMYYSPINPDEPVIKEMIKKYEAKFPPPMNGFMPQFYDGTMWLLEAIKKAGTVTDTDKVRKVFEKLSYDGRYTGHMSWTGKERYGIDHQVKFPFYVMQVKGGREVVVDKVLP